MNKVIATYYEVVSKINKDNELSLIKLWEKNWQKNGFETIVLSENNAQKSLLYEEYRDKVLSFPTVNPIEYERASWMRWLAMSEQKKPMFMADYDCFVYGEFNPDIDKDRLNLFCNHVPCLVFGNPSVFKHTCESIMEYKGDYELLGSSKYHFSDMYWLREYIKTSSNDLKIHKKCVFKYEERNLKKEIIIHYSNGSMKGKKPKYIHIPLLEIQNETN